MPQVVHLHFVQLHDEASIGSLWFKYLVHITTALNVYLIMQKCGIILL